MASEERKDLTRIGITGHQRLKYPERCLWVSSEIDRILVRSPGPIVGLSSLAIGADQLFADLILRRGGTLQAVIPFSGYELKFPEGSGRQEYDRLLGLASKVEILPKMGSDEEAYFAAGKRLVDLSDLLLAVWDGRPAAGLGGTADVVRYALNEMKTVVHINPDTMTVTQHPQGVSRAE